MTKSNKNLTSVLWIIGKSNTPLSSGQIENETQMSKYLFDMLEFLAPSNNNMKFTKLFVLDDISSQNIKNDVKINIISKIVKTYKLDWKIEKTDLELKLNVDREINKYYHTLKISLGNEKYIEIKEIHIHYPSQFRELKISDGREKRIYEIIIKRNQQKKLTVYAINRFSTWNDYLDISYNEETQKRISLIKNSTFQYFGMNGIESKTRMSLEKHDRLIRLQSNRASWRYSLNIRGLLLYLYLEFKNNRRDRNKRVKQVISNPLIKNEFIFLNLWEQFEKNDFPVIEKLFSIALGLSNQIKTRDKDYLLFRVTETYFFEIENYFGSFWPLDIIMTYSKINGFIRYRLEILKYFKDRLNFQLEYVYNKIDKLEPKQ